MLQSLINVIPTCEQPAATLANKHQHFAVIPNDIPWYILGGSILVLSALCAYGVQTTFNRWQKDAEFPKWVNVAGGIFGILLATAMSALAGHIVWNWSLGMMCGVCGSWGSQWVLGLVSARFGAKA